MQHRPTIAIAIPSFEKEAYIERSIKSVLLQGSLVDQIIVIDNSSTDKTYEIAKKFEPQIECYRNEMNIGLAPNWNRCIELCNADWLLILHADDELEPGAIEHYRSIFEKFPSLGIIHADSYIAEEGAPSSKQLASRGMDEFYSRGIEALTCHYGVCSTVMVKKEAYLKLGGFVKDSLSSDVEMWARIASSYDLGSLAVPTATYYVSPHSTGALSLIDRTVTEIKKDWDDLNHRMALLHPEGKERDTYLAKLYDNGPSNYWTVAKANLRARKFGNVASALKVIIFDYHGFFQLINLSTEGVVNQARKYVNRKFKTR